MAVLRQQSRAVRLAVVGVLVALVVGATAAAAPGRGGPTPGPGGGRGGAKPSTGGFLAALMGKIKHIVVLMEEVRCPCLSLFDMPALCRLVCCAASRGLSWCCYMLSALCCVGRALSSVLCRHHRRALPASHLLPASLVARGKRARGTRRPPTV